MRFAFIGLLTLVLSSMNVTAIATLVINFPDTTTTIDFDNSVDDVNNGVWAGTGFQSTPAAGQLDSDSWAVTGWSNGDLAFGGTQTTATTDYTRGTTGGGVTTGGFYALTSAPTGGRALWIQPGGSDFAPGTLTLRVLNNTGSAAISFSVDYDLLYRNDQGRANSFNFSYSINDVLYTSVGSLDFTSPEAADALGNQFVDKSTTISLGTPLADGSFFYLRWSSADVSGSGSRDEFGLDNIAVSASVVPEASAFLFGALICSVLGMVHFKRRRATIDSASN